MGGCDALMLPAALEHGKQMSIPPLPQHGENITAKSQLSRARESNQGGCAADVGQKSLTQPWPETAGWRRWNSMPRRGLLVVGVQRLLVLQIEGPPA